MRPPAKTSLSRHAWTAATSEKALAGDEGSSCTLLVPPYDLASLVISLKKRFLQKKVDSYKI